jgi:hypothetical protein
MDIEALRRPVGPQRREIRLHPRGEHGSVAIKGRMKAGLAA